MRHLNRRSISGASSVEWSGSRHRARRRVFPAPWEMLISRTLKWVAAYRRGWPGPSLRIPMASSRMTTLCLHLAPRHLQPPRRALRACSVFTTHPHTLHNRRTVLIPTHIPITLPAFHHRLLSSNSQCSKLVQQMLWHTGCRPPVRSRRPPQVRWATGSCQLPLPPSTALDRCRVAQVQTTPGDSTTGFESSRQSVTLRFTARSTWSKSSRGGQAGLPARSRLARCPHPC